MNGFEHWALTGAIFAPVIGAAVLGLAPRRAEAAIKSGALLSSLVSLGFVVYLMAKFDYSHSNRLQFAVNNSWIDVIHSRYHIGVDGISLPLLALSALISVLCIIYSWDHFPDPHHPKAPTVGSVILAAILLKLGTYGFVRIAIPILPKAAHSWAPWIGLLSVIGIIYGALGCLAQRDMKRLIAFSSVAHMGFVMLGIATLTSFGINAAVFGMVAHGLITGMLFFIAGSIQERFGTRELSRLGGLLLQAPRLGWILGFCVFASLGLPGLAGFWGEFPAILSAYQPADGLQLAVFRTYMAVAAIGTVFAAGYLLWMLQRVAFGTVKGEFEKAHIHDVHIPEYLAWAPLLILIVALGVYPNLLFHMTDGAVRAVTVGVHAATGVAAGG